MSHNLSAAPQSPATVTVTVPNPGDNRTAQSVVTPIQALFDAVMWLFGVLTGAIEANLIIDGEATGIALQVFGAVFIGDALNVAGDTRIGGKATVVGNASVGGGLNVTDNTIIGGNLSAVSGTTALGATQVIAPMRFLSSGRTIAKAQVVTPTVGLTVAPAVANYWNFTSVPSGGAVVTISDTTAIDGDWMWFNNPSHVDSVDVAGPGGSTIASLRSASGFASSALIIRVGGVWTRFLHLAGV